MRRSNLSKMEQHYKPDTVQYEELRYDEFFDYHDIGYDVSDKKSKKHFVDYIKNIFKNSLEYKIIMDFLKTNLDMNRCMYCKNIDTRYKGMINIHHEPFSKEDLCYIVLNKYIELDLELDPFIIAEEIMLLHFKGLIGLMPVNVTAHQLIHDKEITVPITYVFGNIREFFIEYKDYMTEDQKEKLANSIQLSSILENATPKVLKKKFIYLDVKGMQFPKRIE